MIHTLFFLFVVISLVGNVHLFQTAHPSNYHYTIPQLIDIDGNFLSYNLSPRKKRSLNDNFEETLHYKIDIQDQAYYFQLKTSLGTFSLNYSVEYWNKNGAHKILKKFPACHYVGTVTNREKKKFSKAVLSNCIGLLGVFSIGNIEYVIQPINNEKHNNAETYPHIIYKRSVSNLANTCSNFPSFNVTKAFMESTPNRKIIVPKTKRSVNFERYLEILVVADKMMVNYHGIKEVEHYILAIMNIVSQLYKDSSIGNSINIVITRLILLLEDQPDLQITHHASQTLFNFCQWQKNINPAYSPNIQKEITSHDNAILITRHDICYDKNEPCDTLGMAHIAGICQPDRSCSINQDIGLVSGYTIAHELGHNFGMQHDGIGNNCKKLSFKEKGYIMSKKLSYLTQPVSWSPCSRDYITDFLDSGQANCMKNVPKMQDFYYSVHLPGEYFEVSQQCISHYGSHSIPCWNKSNICQKLWCTNANGKCVTANIPVLNGTPCSSVKLSKGWCFNGQCRAFGTRPVSINGQWSEWSDWSECSRSCDGGVTVRERFCNSPKPVNGGSLCYGDRKQYKSCQLTPCNANSMDFRELQCSEFNNHLFRGKLYKWTPYTQDHLHPCSLYCQATGYNFFIEKAAKVIDGTRCFPNSTNICVNGQCQPVGCDLQLNSKAFPDECGVCNGDGSTCTTHNGTVILNTPINTFHDVIHIPKHSRKILIKAVEYSTNILAIKSANGTIVVNDQWKEHLESRHVVAGTIFNYQNDAKIFQAPGPTNQDLIISIYVKERDKGIYYEYVRPEDESNKIKCQNCSLNTDEECTDVNKVNYCQMAYKLKFCSRPYFRKLCCATCSRHS